MSEAIRRALSMRALWPSVRGCPQTCDRAPRPPGTTPGGAILVNSPLGGQVLAQMPHDVVAGNFVTVAVPNDGPVSILLACHAPAGLQLETRNQRVEPHAIIMRLPLHIIILILPFQVPERLPPLPDHGSSTGNVTAPPLSRRGNTATTGRWRSLAST